MFNRILRKEAWSWVRFVETIFGRFFCTSCNWTTPPNRFLNVRPSDTLIASENPASLKYFTLEDFCNKLWNSSQCIMDVRPSAEHLEGRVCSELCIPWDINSSIVASHIFCARNWSPATSFPLKDAPHSTLIWLYSFNQIVLRGGTCRIGWSRSKSRIQPWTLPNDCYKAYLGMAGNSTMNGCCLERFSFHA